MAYDKTKLLCVSGETSVLQKGYEYFSSDTVTAKGYFPKESGIKAGDYLTVVKITMTNGLVTAYARTSYYMVADATGALTATAIAD